MNAIADTTLLTGGAFSRRGARSLGRSKIHISSALGSMETSSKPAVDRTAERWPAIRAVQMVALSVFPGAYAAHGANAFPAFLGNDTLAAFEKAPFPVDPTHRVSFEDSAFVAGGEFGRSFFPADSVSHLERLKDGWAGAHTCAPSDAILADVKAATLAIDSVAVAAEIEVDDDGTVIFEWTSGHSSFCLTFNGDGDVIGTLSPWSPGYPAWRVKATDEISLADKLDDNNLAEFFGRE